MCIFPFFRVLVLFYHLVAKMLMKMLGPLGCGREGSISSWTPWLDGVLVKERNAKWSGIFRLLWEAGGSAGVRLSELAASCVLWAQE